MEKVVNVDFVLQVESFNHHPLPKIVQYLLIPYPHPSVPHPLPHAGPHNPPV